MFCPKCGKELSDTAAFCSGCGAAVKREAPAAGQEPKPAEAVQEPKPVADSHATETAETGQVTATARSPMLELQGPSMSGSSKVNGFLFLRHGVIIIKYI